MDFWLRKRKQNKEEGGGGIPEIDAKAKFMQKLHGYPAIRLRSVLRHVENEVGGLEPTRFVLE